MALQFFRNFPHQFQAKASLGYKRFAGVFGRISWDRQTSSLSDFGLGPTQSPTGC